MNILRKIAIYFKKPKIVINVILHHISPFIKDDERYIKLKWKFNMSYPLDLNNPKTFNEKLQWLKIHDRKPIYSTMVDKYAAKEYVANIIGKEHIIPTIAVYDNVEDIDFDTLPNQFVLKCTHDSGGLVICKDKNNLDYSQAVKKLNHYFHRQYYWSKREWPYKNVPHRIIAEKYMTMGGVKHLLQTINSIVLMVKQSTFMSQKGWRITPQPVLVFCH